MKLLFLNYEYPPLGGGAANATKYLLREFAKRDDLEVHLVTSGLGVEERIENVGGRVFVHFLPIGKDERHLHSQSQKDLLVYSWKAWRYASQLAREARRDGKLFDATIAFFGVPCGVIALWLKWRYGLPYIVSLRGSDVPGYSEKFDRIYWILRPLIKAVWRGAQAVVPNSRGLLELARKSSPKQKMIIIPNGVDTEEFKPDPKRERDGIFRILVVGRLTPRKGIRFLIRAMAILKDKHPDDRMELWLVGDGEERPILEALAQEVGVADRVKFFGLVSHNELPRYYGLSDIFCLPSQNEGMSNTVLEALAAGLPIVATVTGGTEELVADGENGSFVQKESPKDLAEKIGVIIADEELRQRMGEKSRQRAEKMNWASVAEQFLGLCSKKELRDSSLRSE